MVRALLLLAATALAAQGDGEEPEDEPEEEPDPTALDEFEILPELDQERYRWLRPDRGALRPIHTAQVDFTAYTLEWGEVRLGTGSVCVGVAPRVQAGTVPLLDLLGVYNVQGKANFLTLGTVDLAAEGSYYVLPIGDFVGRYGSAGGQVSVRPTEALSVHAGGSWSVVSMDGVPDLSRVSNLLVLAAGADPEGWEFDPGGVLGDLDPRLAADALWTEVAADYRFNRRDSVILRGSAMVWAAVRADLGYELDDVDLPPIAGLDQALTYEGGVPIGETYAFSLSYQASLRNLDFRVGAGWSAVPWYWLLQSVEVAGRFGGRTRRQEARMNEGWREGRRDIGGSGDRTGP